RIISLQGPQPNHVTHGVGVAWGSKLLGEDSVTWIAFGDGGAQKGEVHEAMNFAAIHRLPCVFCVENNGYTQSVPLRLESARADRRHRRGGDDRGRGGGGMGRGTARRRPFHRYAAHLCVGGRCCWPFSWGPARSGPRPRCRARCRSLHPLLSSPRCSVLPNTGRSGSTPSTTASSPRDRSTS